MSETKFPESNHPLLAARSWYPNNKDLQHPVLSTPHLTFGERIWAVFERYDLNPKIITLVAVAAIASFGLWYGGFIMASGVVDGGFIAAFTLGGLAVLGGAHQMRAAYKSSDEFDNVFANKKYFLMKKELASSPSRRPRKFLHFVAREADIVALALFLQNPKCDRYLDENVLGFDGNAPILHVLVARLPRNAAQLTELPQGMPRRIEVLIQMLLNAGADPTIRVATRPGQFHNALELAKKESPLAAPKYVVDMLEDAVKQIKPAQRKDNQLP